MKLIYIGKFVNTHGLKGEIRIISDFEYKSEVFLVGNTIYIDKNKYTIDSYRKHKNYDMVKLSGIDDINKIEFLKGSKVYINNDDYNFEYVYSDLIGMGVYDKEKFVGKVKDILKGDLYPILKIEYKKEYMVPYMDKFIDSVDTKTKRIYIKYMKGLYDEN